MFNIENPEVAVGVVACLVVIVITGTIMEMIAWGRVKKLAVQHHIEMLELEIRYNNAEVEHLTTIVSLQGQVRDAHNELVKARQQILQLDGPDIFAVERSDFDHDFARMQQADDAPWPVNT